MAELFALVGIPSTRFLDDVVLHGKVERSTFSANAFAVHDVELGLLKGRSHLIFYDLDSSAVTHHLDPILDGLDPADIEPDGGVELERTPTWRGLW